jgi:hypothetical protein
MENSILLNSAMQKTLKQLYSEFELTELDPSDKMDVK